MFKFTVGRPLNAMIALSRPSKQIVVVAADAAIALFAVWLAFYLRTGIVAALTGNQWLAALAALGALPLLWSAGIYRAIFRYVGLEAMVDAGRVCLVYGAIYAIIFTFMGVVGVPRTVGLIQPLLFFLGIAASRTAARALVGRFATPRSTSRVLIYGAGSSGRQLAAAIAGAHEMELVAFVDDDPTLRGAQLNDKRIYSADHLATLVENEGVTDILLALPSIGRQRRAEIIDGLRGLHTRIRTIPGLIDLAHGHIEVSSLRPIEIEDLLGRDTAAPDPVLFARNILGKTVLVTGAGGSIGSELCRQIIAAHPATLLLLENSEFALYAIESEMRQLLPAGMSSKLIPLLGSVRDAERMNRIMAAWSPDTVYHAAAYKHVPLVEYNPAEGVLNNVWGTLVTARAAVDAGVKDFVLISTDKAVRPTNIMGATKRMAEQVLQALAEDRPTTRLSMVRFGNVLGSSGSVVPLFRKQIAAGGPVTITHGEVTRYFMTIPEAAQLVIQAGAMATNGGEVFILDMGEPVRIVDLAHKMIELSGMTVRDAENTNGDIEINVVGLRPGEKLYEELLIGADPEPTTHSLIMRAREHHLPLSTLEPLIDELLAALAAGKINEAVALIQRAVPEFAPVSAPVDLLAAREDH